MDLKSQRRVRFSANGFLESVPAWSADSSLLIFALGNDGADLWSQPLGGAPGRRILAQADHREFRINPVLSTFSSTADGRFIVFAAEGRGSTQSDLWLLPLQDAGESYSAAATGVRPARRSHLSRRSLARVRIQRNRRERDLRPATGDPTGCRTDGRIIRSSFAGRRRRAPVAIGQQGVVLSVGAWGGHGCLRHARRSFVTPLLAYGVAASQPKTPFEELRSWGEYVGAYRAVLIIRVLPKVSEGFLSRLNRAVSEQMYSQSVAKLKFKTNFSRMRLFCCATEVQPIQPGKIAWAVDVRNKIVDLRGNVSEGFYAFEPNAIRPDCKSVRLEITSQTESEKPSSKVLSQQLVEQVWADFESYRASSTTDSRPR